jgi:hypothetical protein
MSSQAGSDEKEVPSMLIRCTTCQHFQWPELVSTILYLRDIRSTAANGCQNCSVLDTGLSAYFSNIPDLAEKLDRRGVKLRWTKFRKGELVVSVRHWGIFDKEKDFDFGILHLSFYFPDRMYHQCRPNVSQFRELPFQNPC